MALGQGPPEPREMAPEVALGEEARHRPLLDGRGARIKRAEGAEQRLDEVRRRDEVTHSQAAMEQPVERAELHDPAVLVEALEAANRRSEPQILEPGVLEHDRAGGAGPREEAKSPGEWDVRAIERSDRDARRDDCRWARILTHHRSAAIRRERLDAGAGQAERRAELRLTRLVDEDTPLRTEPQPRHGCRSDERPAQHDDLTGVAARAAGCRHVGRDLRPQDGIAGRIGGADNAS